MPWYLSFTMGFISALMHLFFTGDFVLIYNRPVWITSWEKEFPQEKNKIPFLSASLIQTSHMFNFNFKAQKMREQNTKGTAFWEAALYVSKDIISTLQFLGLRYTLAILLHLHTLIYLQAKHKTIWSPHKMDFLFPHSNLLWRNDILILHIGYWREHTHANLHMQIQEWPVCALH